MKLRITYLAEHSVCLSNRTTWPMANRAETLPAVASRYVNAYQALIHKSPEEREAIVAALLRAEKRQRRRRK